MPRHHCQRDALLLSASACQFRWSIAAHSGLLDHEHRAAACRTPCALFCVGIRTFASMLQGQEPPADRTLCNRQAGRPQSWSAPDLSAGSWSSHLNPSRPRTARCVPNCNLDTLLWNKISARRWTQSCLDFSRPHPGCGGFQHYFRKSPGTKHLERAALPREAEDLDV